MIMKKEMKTFSNDISTDYLKELFLSNISPAIWCKFMKREFIKIQKFLLIQSMDKI